MFSGKKLCSASLAVAGVLSAAPGAAQDTVRAGTYLGVSVGSVQPDEGPRDADSAYGIRLVLGWNVVEQLSLESAFSYTVFEDQEPADKARDYFRGNDGQGDSYRTALGADLVWTPLRGWSPYALAGLGAAYNDGDPRDNSGFSLSTAFGLGLTSGAMGTHGVRLSAEARWVMDNYGEKPRDKMFYASFSFPLRPGEATQRASSRPRKPPPPVVTVLPPLTATTSTRPQASTLDSDRDGISDTHDRCASTLPGMRIDEVGCAAEGAIATLRGLRFQDGSASIEPTSTTALLPAVAALKGQPSMTFELRGHTDSVGDPAVNQRLSEDRARSVAKYLEAQGIEDWRITVSGFGESRQEADNTTAEGRAANRRVELRVLLP